MRAADAVAEPATRRGRLRESTLAEIRTTARRLLVEHGSEAVSLRAIAREMGMSAPALYRYYDSREDLLTALAVDCYEELVGTMTTRRDALPPDATTGLALMTVSRTFREWSIGHQKEFGLLFASPMPTLLHPSDDPLQDVGRRFGMVFGELFIRLWAEQPFPVSAQEDLDPGVVQQLQAYDEALRDALPIGALYVFLQCWTRLYGQVCLEVFGHLGWVLLDAEPFFESLLGELSVLLGFSGKGADG